MLTEASDLLSRSNFTVFALDDKMRLGGTLEEAASKARTGKDHAFALALEAIANIAVLSDGALFAGIFHSNFGRLSAEFAYAKGRPLAPFFFLDEPNGGNEHVDLVAYFQTSFAPTYAKTRAARVAAGLPAGLYL